MTRKLTKKRFEELWDEVEETMDTISPNNYHDGMRKLVAAIQEGKTALELFYCGIICEHILNHLEEDSHEEEQPREEKKRYIN